MPATITHYVFLKELHLEDNKVYNIGTQGPDPFFFYEYGIRKLPNSKKIAQIGHFLHDINPIITFNYFVKLIKNEHNEYTRKVLKDYLFGIVSHYALDSTAHSYIFYKSGFVTEEDKNSKKFFLSHATIEHNIDVLIRDKYGYKINPIQALKIKNKDLKIISNTWYKYLKDTFKYDYISQNNFQIGLKRMRFIYKILYSKTGFRKAIFNKFFHNSALNAFSHPRIKKVLPYDFLNLKKEAYKHPVTGVESNYSFIELMEKGKERYNLLATEIEKLINEYYNDNKLKEIIDDIDHNGKKVDSVMKYYDYLLK